MKEKELEDLRAKKEVYDDIIRYLKMRQDRHAEGSVRRKALESMIRTLDNQLSMIKFAIYGRETKK